MIFAPSRDRHRFNPQHFGTLAELKRSAESRPCEIVMVACPDHGTAPDNVSFGDCGQFYIIQSLAASVPPTGDKARLSIVAGIEYALRVMNAKHVIVCQHLGCRILSNRLRRPNEGRQVGRRSLEPNAQPAVDRRCPRAIDRDRTRLMIGEHLLKQLENLQSHKIVQSRLREGRLRLHGWLADDWTARVQSFDASRGRFVPIEQL